MPIATSGYIPYKIQTKFKKQKEKAMPAAPPPQARATRSGATFLESEQPWVPRPAWTWESLGGPAGRGAPAGLSPWSPVERTLTFGCRQAPRSWTEPSAPEEPCALGAGKGFRGGSISTGWFLTRSFIPSSAFLPEHLQSLPGAVWNLSGEGEVGGLAGEA